MEYNEPLIKLSRVQFLFPFSYQDRKKQSFKDQINQNGFSAFSIDDKTKETAYYGKNFNVSHNELDQYFLPYIENFLFPEEVNARGFHRYSKKFEQAFSLEKESHSFQFDILSLDITLCPFEIGFITIRCEYNKEKVPLSSVLDFIHHFRTLEPRNHDYKVKINAHSFETGEDFIFNSLTPFLKEFVTEDTNRAGYYGSLPFYLDERMFAVGLFQTEQDADISETALFNMSEVNGTNPLGEPITSANNPTYIKKYSEKHGYHRYAPVSYYMTSDQLFGCLTNESSSYEMRKLVSNMEGIHYYNLLLHLFYKIVLLKLSYEYSQINYKKDYFKVEHLIQLITVFSSRYLFTEISSRTEGKELSSLFSNVFKIEKLYSEAKETLSALYQNQQKRGSRRQNYLLFVLTTFTVVSGIYGMNLVIKDWEGTVKWRKVLSYSFFEYIALFVALSGITISFAMGVVAFCKIVKEFRHRGKWPYH
jgi:hypothetical protein